MKPEGFKQDCLRDHKFQNWLAEKQVMSRRPIEQTDLQLTQKEINGQHIGERLLGQLHRQTGYIVSTEELGANLYGETNEDNRERVNAVAFDLKNRKLKDPTVIFHAKELGWAVGVEDLAVTAASLLILYKLWLDLPDWVDEQEISQTVYGTIHESDIASVRRQTLKLRHKELPHTKARIEMDQIGKPSRHSYRLIGNEREYTQAELTPSYLDLGFQNWMAHPEIGLIKRKHARFREEKAADKTRKDMQLLATLQEYNGFIVPYNLLSYILYHSEDKVAQVRETFSNLKDRDYINPQDVYVFPNLGLGYGIRDVKVTQNQMKLLHALWEEKDDGAAIPKLLLAREIYGIAVERFEPAIESLVSKTRKSLADAKSNCTIETTKVNNSVAYMLGQKTPHRD